jgi:predicted nucleic acid-binding protein
LAVTGLLLVDKSAYARGAAAADRENELCLCAVTRMELLYSARSPADFLALQDEVAEFRDLRMDAATFSTAASAQRELAAMGWHRLPIADLLLGACAHQHGADVLHVDRHFEALASVLSFRSVRL